MSIKFLNRLVGSLCVKNVYKKIEPLRKVKRLNRSNNQQLKTIDFVGEQTNTRSQAAPCL